jgi:hypothetical protein
MRHVMTGCRFHCIPPSYYQGVFEVGKKVATEGNVAEVAADTRCDQAKWHLTQVQWKHYNSDSLLSCICVKTCILDHGIPDNVNSAYIESAHIPNAKVTSQNTQK